MSVIRFTVVDTEGTTSFVGPCHTIKMLVAACSRNPSTTQELLEYTRPFDETFVHDVRSGLSKFDEHNTRDDTDAFHGWVDELSNPQLPPFRIFDETMRQESLKPADTGVLVLNLKEQRIVQVQNSYEEVQRQDRGRIRRQGEPIPILYRYKLPDSWRIVP
ncbi:MAG: hypothetical protein WD401_00010 [Thermomicrobiaceae bacterium]